MHLSKSKIIIGISVLIALSVAGCLLIAFLVSKLSDYLGSRPEYLMAENFVTHSPACQALLAEGETWKARSMSVHYSLKDGRAESNGAYSFVTGSWLFPDKEVEVRWRRVGQGPIHMEAYNRSRDFDLLENLPRPPVQVEVGITTQSPPEGLIDSATLPMDGSRLPSQID